MSNKLPIILVVDDDAQVLRAITRDVRSRYKTDYQVLSTTNPAEALDLLEDLKKDREEIALFLSDQRMPEMLGVDFLEQAKKLFPEAKRLLLTAYSDTDAAIRAINDVQLDYYLMKPWDPPEEKLYPVLDEQLEAWQYSHVPIFRGIQVIGYTYSPPTHNLKDFLASNLIPYRFLDFKLNPDAKVLLEELKITESDLPVIIFEDNSFIPKPALAEVARKLGYDPQAKASLYDVVIIGGGPAGLAAAVYGASEGLKTLLIERRATGGQAGSSSRIENYLGFPTGLSGSDLAKRATAQARRFGAELLAPQEVKNITLVNGQKVLSLQDEQEVIARAVIIATGVEYRKLEVPGIDAFSGAGVYYGAATTEASACQSRKVFIVGGGNSAGQGAVYLSKFAAEVTILVRKPDLTATMSSYLIDQIAALPNISVKGFSETEEVIGTDGVLSHIKIKDVKTGAVETHLADVIFVFIGVRPSTDWLDEMVPRDEKGFLLTGRELGELQDHPLWKNYREPMMLETGIPGIFAAGDVRSGAMNRVASAVGEGSMSIKMVHEYLAMQ